MGLFGRENKPHVPATGPFPRSSDPSGAGQPEPASVPAPSLRAPSASTPWHDAHAAGVETYAPLDTTEAPALLITAAQMLPPFDELPEGADPAAVRAWAEDLGQDPDELSFVWDEFARGPSGPWSSLGHRSNIGGAAEFTPGRPTRLGQLPGRVRRRRPAAGGAGLRTVRRLGRRRHRAHLRGSTRGVDR